MWGCVKPLLNNRDHSINSTRILNEILLSRAWQLLHLVLLCIYFHLFPDFAASNLGFVTRVWAKQADCNQVVGMHNAQLYSQCRHGSCYLLAGEAL